jgi:6-phosphogluconolactonase
MQTHGIIVNWRRIAMGSSHLGCAYPASLVVVVLLQWLQAVQGCSGAAQAQSARKESDQLEVFRVYVGTYTGGRGQDHSQGIYLLELDLRSGRLSSPRVAGASINPSFLAIHPSRKFLYAVNEVGEFKGRPSGAVSAFAIDPARGSLTLLNQQSSVGSGPCHLVVDQSGKNVLVANYGSGSVACLPIGADGRLKSESSFSQHHGSGSKPARQAGPHAHSINLDQAGRFAAVADLGLDKVFIYRFDESSGKLVPNRPSSVSIASGSGPRHFAFHPNRRFSYVINEMANTVTAFAFDAGEGSLASIQTIATLPEEFKGTSHTAEVQVHPSGKFLYGSNRGHDSIAIFAIDPETGKLTTIGFEPTQGKNPRNFAIDPTGAYLLAENGESNTIVVFSIDPQTGILRPTGQKVRVPKPVCIKMIPKPGTTAR